MNRIRDELRKAQHRPESIAIEPALPDATASPLESAIGLDGADRRAHISCCTDRSTELFRASL
jgi:hypothetical protein